MRAQRPVLQSLGVLLCMPKDCLTLEPVYWAQGCNKTLVCLVLWAAARGSVKRLRKGVLYLNHMPSCVQGQAAGFVMLRAAGCREERKKMLLFQSVPSILLQCSSCHSLLQLQRAGSRGKTLWPVTEAQEPESSLVRGLGPPSFGHFTLSNCPVVRQGITAVDRLYCFCRHYSYCCTVLGLLFFHILEASKSLIST